MNISRFAIGMAEANPRAADQIARIWGKLSLTFSGSRAFTETHWLLQRLTAMSGARIPTKAILSNGMTIVVPWNDFVGEHLRSAGSYEIETVRLFETIVKPGMIVFDVGAHVGHYTLVTSGLAGRDGQVHSFEADPVTWKWLSKNVSINKLSNVRINGAAVSDKTGYRDLFRSVDVSCNSLEKPTSDYDGQMYSGQKVRVSCITLDDYAKTQKIQRVDLIKMDIEGAEFLALKGAAGILGSEHNPILIVEFEEPAQRAFGSSCGELAEFLEARGYSLYCVGTPPLTKYIPGPDAPVTCNVLAIPMRLRNKLASILG